MVIRRLGAFNFDFEIHTCRLILPDIAEISLRTTMTNYIDSSLRAAQILPNNQSYQTCGLWLIGYVIVGLATE